MVVFGIFLLVVGAIAEFVANNHVTVGNQSWDMDTIGMIMLVLGVVSILIGFAFTAMYTNTSHREHDVIVDKKVDETPVVIKRRKRL